jgi:hypothetical protein
MRYYHQDSFNIQWNYYCIKCDYKIIFSPIYNVILCTDLVSVCKCNVMYYTNILMNIEHAQNALKLNTYFKQTDILEHRLLQKV